MAKVGDVCRIGLGYCLVYCEDSGKLGNIILQGNAAGSIGSLTGREMEPDEPIFNLIDLISTLAKRGELP